MTYIIKCNNDWFLFNNVPSNYTRFDHDKDGPYLKCGKVIVRGEQLFFALDEIECWIEHSVDVARQTDQMMDQIEE